jgi:hypothetical protein
LLSTNTDHCRELNATVEQLKSTGTYKQANLLVPRPPVITHPTHPKMISKGKNRIDPEHLLTYRTRKHVKESTGAGIDIVELKVEKRGRSMSHDGSIH